MQIEVETLRVILDTQVLPAAFSYHGHLAQGAVAAKSLGVSAPQLEVLNRISGLSTVLQTRRTELEAMIQRLESLKSEEEKAKVYATQISQVMLELRKASDDLEAVIADDFWPLPKYREMLFLG
jgi:glutamine synthetase